MSTLKVTNINHASASTGGLAIDSSGVVTGALPSPNRNLIYNGAMQVAQRGTSTASITTSGYYTADRINLVLSSLATWTQSVESDAPSGSGFRKSVKMLCTTSDAAPASGSICLFGQRIEGQDLQRIAKGTASAQQLTLSFWVKSNVTGTYVAELYDVDNTRQVSATYTVSASATWEKKTITFPADTTGALDNDNAQSLQVWFGLAVGSNYSSGTLNTSWASTVNANRYVGQTNLAAATNNYWQITGVQLEVGPTATPFEFKSYGQELAECQRYYYRIQPNGTQKALTPVGRNTGTTSAQFTGPFKVSMRTAPTALEQSGTATDYQINHRGIATQCSAVPTFGSSTTTEFFVINTTVASGLTDGDASLFTTDPGSSAGYLAWSAEL